MPNTATARCRNTGNTYWCAGRDPADYDNSRYQSGCDPIAGDAQPGFFLPIRSATLPVASMPTCSRASTTGVHRLSEQDLRWFAQPYRGRLRLQRQREDLLRLLPGQLRTEARGISACVVRTKQFAQSSDSIEKFNDYFLTTRPARRWRAPTLPLRPTRPTAARAASCACRMTWRKTYSLIGVDRTYTDVLPSFNIAWDITDTLVLRGAASKVIARLATPTSQHRAH